MFDKFKDKITKAATEGFAIPITSKMIAGLIEKKTGEIIDVHITSEHITLQGTTEIKIMMLTKKVAFTIILKPVQIDKRTILFQLVQMKPFDIKFINNKLFNKPPFFEYHKRRIKIDFNSWDVVKKVPVGQIRSFELVEGALNIKLSL
ncbi:hypothetical protein ACQKL5_11355 [Peribacillus sp. NPDC097675]|uniref:hypothetical protein n=1 Tax=Peribacillus sp. NPDC097675 TaxID=3390618 RepID=UPI003D056013